MKRMASRRSLLRAGAAGGAGIITSAAFGRAYAAASPAILGCYVGNPNGNDHKAMGEFEQNFDSFVATLGSKPAFMNVFTDFTRSVEEMVASAGWGAWSCSLSSRSRDITPVIGLPMAVTADWKQQPAVGTFRDIAAGRYDNVWSGIVGAWRDNGYHTVYIRPGYEMNGSFMVWFMGRDPASVAVWTAAFARIASIVHAVQGVSVRVVWNPDNLPQAGDVPSSYPGDAAVDVIGIDIYNSNMWPLSLYNFSSRTTEPSLAAWLRDPTNREHYWDHPGGTSSTPEGRPSESWGMARALAFARQHGKPVAVCETGLGVDPSHPEHGVADEGAFPAYLASRLFAPDAPRVEFVNIWDVNIGDGTFRFSDGSKPQASAAWRKAFGAKGLPA